VASTFFDTVLKDRISVTVNNVSVIRNKDETAKIEAILDNWQCLCSSKVVHIAYDETTQLGLYANVQIKAGDGIAIGDLRRVQIGERAYAVVPPGHKWSSVHNHAICGPYSMLNHACSNHANVDTDFEKSDLFAIRDIEPMEELLVEYASEEYLKIHNPSVQCMRCREGVI